MRLSKPLFALLSLSVSLSILALLLPEPAQDPGAADTDLAAARPRAVTASPTMHRWQRAAAGLPWREAPPQAAPASAKPFAQPSSSPLAANELATLQRPVAPHPGFRYLGRMMRDDATWIFLGLGEDTYALQPGQTFDGQWRLDAVRADRLELTYLPLKSPQTLRLDE